MQLAATTAARPIPTEYDRFRNHMGAAFAQLGEAKSESTWFDFTDSTDVTDAIRTAKVAVYKLEKALDLGYQNSDDSGSYAGSAAEYATAGIEALSPFAGVRFDEHHQPAGLVEAMATAKQNFAQAQSDVLESLSAMHD
jgi:hypothetical protein